jgi:WD40 repeat protein
MNFGSLPPGLVLALDRACDDFEAAWDAGAEPRIEDYLGRVPDPAREALLEALLASELEQRHRRGERPEAREYGKRFPEQAELIASLCAAEPATWAGLPAPAGHDGARPRRALPAVPGYTIEGELGRGGMGVVYLARQILLSRPCALKMILVGAHAGSETAARFLAEAQAVAKLQHPNVVQVYHVGEADGLPFLEMEYLAGGSLDHSLRDGTPWAADRAARLIEPLANAVAEAHRCGIVHRDLKPANILLGIDGMPKIADFGLARTLDSESGLTRTEAVIGSPSYMAPEQAEGRARQAGPAADVYALGAILYHVLTGRPPFKAATVDETLEQVKRADPVAPSRLAPGLPRDIETICLACLRKDPARRYPSAEALADDLRRFSSGESILARPSGPTERTWRWCRRNPAVTALAAAVGLLLIALVLGATTAAMRLGRARDSARAAELRRTEQLWESYLAQARAGRLSRHAGQRFASLEALINASKIRITEGLRNEAVACLANVDLRLVRPLEATPEPGCAIVADMDVERYAVADRRGGIRVLSAADDRELLQLPGEGELCKNIYFSPDGRRLAADYGSGLGHRVLIWDLNRRKPIAIPHSDAYAFGEFSPDGRRFAVPLEGDSIGFFDTDTGALEAKSPVAPDSLFGFAFHPDGRRLATIGMESTTARLIDPERGEVWSHHFETNFSSIAWRPDGRLLALGGDDQRIYVWDMAEDRLLSVLEGHQNVVIGLAFNRGGRLLISCSWDGTTRIWDPVRGRALLSTLGVMSTTPPVGRRIAFTESRYTFSDDNRLSVWELAEAAECRILHHGTVGNRTRRPTVSGPSGLTFHPGGRLLASTGQDGVRIWDTTAGTEIAHLLEGLAFSPDGSQLLTSGADGLHLRTIHYDPNAAGGRLRLGEPREVGAAKGLRTGWVSWDRSGRFLAVQVDRPTAIVLDLETSAEVARFVHPALDRLSLSPDGRWLATSTWKGRGIKVWDVTRRALAREWDSPMAFVAFSPDGRWLATSVDREEYYQLWDVGSWRPGPMFPALRFAGRMAFSEGPMLLALGQGGPVQLIDPAGGREVMTLESASGFSDMISALTLSPDGRLLAVGTGDHTILLWDLELVRKQLAALGLE